MKIRSVSARYLVLGLALYLGALIAVHLVTDTVHIVWTGVGTGTVMLGVAAMVTVMIKVYREIQEYMEKTDELEVKVNGGLAEAARNHLQDNEVFESLIVRMDRIERERDDCEEALTELREFVINRTGE